jgi:hypothetical protein
LYQGDRIVFTLVIESQLRIDPDKPYAWGVYQTAQWAKYRVPTLLLVLTPHRHVARWARKTFHVLEGFNSFTPMVLGPDSVPPITSDAVAQAAPEAAVLAALVHHRGPKALTVARTALRAAARLDDARRVLYTEAIVRMAHEAHRASLEEFMNQLRIPRNYKWLYKPMQEYVEETRREGISEGKAEGKAEGKIDALITVLNARGLTISEEQRLQMESCHDLATLDRWILAAFTAASVEELLAVH